MVSKTFNRYIWLVNTLMQRGKLTFDEISTLWKGSGLGDGKPMSLRTFHQHRKAVEELFGIDTERQDASVVAELVYAVEHDYCRPQYEG